MQVQTSVKVSWHRPRTYNDGGEARQIADDLYNNRSVILNLEDIDKKEARRLLDFLSGVAYARSSLIRKIAMNVYLFGPHNLDFVGDELMTMLEENNYL
jgi:cell division inhibitor SepF